MVLVQKERILLANVAWIESMSSTVSRLVSMQASSLTERISQYSKLNSHTRGTLVLIPLFIRQRTMKDTHKLQPRDWQLTGIL